MDFVSSNQYQTATLIKWLSLKCVLYHLTSLYRMSANDNNKLRIYNMEIIFFKLCMNFINPGLDLH